MNQDFSRQSSVLTFSVPGAFVAALKVLALDRDRGMSRGHVGEESVVSGAYYRPVAGELETWK